MKPPTSFCAAGYGERGERERRINESGGQVSPTGPPLRNS
jgi:hypothetical protein